MLDRLIRLVASALVAAGLVVALSVDQVQAVPKAPFNRAQFSLQYTMLTQFNGSCGNYDGFQRNGLANSTLCLLMWPAI